MQMKGKNGGGLGTRLLEIKGLQLSMFSYCYIGEDKNKWTSNVTFVCIEEHAQKVNSFIFSVHLWREGEEMWMWGEG